ncbi:MAG: hypothetical protein ISS72_04680, partial [Candidatus Brocadiae bacterium]|nr:hypothetical protein [Candidatus Brocadiia bacterium]
MPRAIRALAAACSVALLAALVSCSVPWLKAEQDESPQALQAAWKRHLDALKHHPAILRLYTFDTVTAEAPAAPSLAGEAEPLKYVAREPLALVEGRWPGQQAVRLDRGFFEGKPFAVDGKSFTVEMWFRKHGHGAELGNGRTSGMLFAQGDGYWSGVRVWTSYPSRELIFELGRPKPSHSFGTTARDPVPDGVWHHLAATWDGKEMRLYLNGLLLHRAEYAGAYAKPEAPFRIGFADAGVGSLKMDVDEVAVFRRALPAEEVLRHAHFQAELPPATAQRFAAATTAMARRDWPAAERALAPIVGSRRAPARYRAVARLALGHALQKQNKVHEAVAEYAAVFDATAAPASLREIAVRLCMPSDRGAASAQASPRVYHRLLELPELTEAQRLAVRLSLAEQYMQTGKAARAREQYEAALRSPALAAREAWDVRLQIAHTFLRAGDAKAARAAYEELAANTEAPSALRSHALLAAAQTHVRQKAYAKAAGVFARVAAFDEAPRHHRQEAKERIEEMKRIQKGLPARDPTASRTKLALFPSPAVTLHVAPTGHDDNPGTKDKPFASLARARDAVRALRAAKSLPKGGVAVLVRGGQYAARSTLELAEQDSGTADAPIVYRAFPGETPRFTGGVQLEGFAPVTDPTVLARLPEEARGKVAQLDLKAKGIADYGSLGLRGFGLSGYPAHPWADLYVDGKPMQLARWPNEGFVKTGAVHGGTFRGKDSGQPGEFEYAGDRPLRWRQAKDVWLFGYWAHLWAGRSVKVARIDTAKHRIATAHRSSYGYRAGMPYYCLNLLEEIDRPGEWYLDRDTGVLYLYPPVAGKAVVAHFPVLSAPFVRMQDVSHVCLRGLVFEQGRAEGAVVIGGERVLLAGCVFRQLGTNGVVVSGGRGHGLLGCNIHTVGAGGVRMAGGHRGSLRRGDHFVANCHIHDFTRIDR